MIHAHESKAVGWEGERIGSYPSSTDVAQAGRLQLVRWWRYLRNPADGAEAQVLIQIRERLKETE